MDRLLNCDAAALHPDIGVLWKAPGKLYFKRAAASAQKIKARLRETLGTRHELFLVGNTSGGLIAVLLGALLGGGGFPRLLNRPYSFYEKLLGYPAGLSGEGRLVFCTHISPLTGEVVDLRAWRDSILIVDAAQSLGTVFQSDLVSMSAVFIGPFHKHLNLVPGLGVVGVDFAAVEGVGEGLRTTLEVMEHGTTNLGILEACVRRLEERGGELSVNKVRIHIGPQLQSAAAEVGLRVITPAGIQAHIASFTSREDLPVNQVVDASCIGARVFDRENMLRISLHSDVHGAMSPEEYEAFVVAALRVAGKPRLPLSKGDEYR